MCIHFVHFVFYFLNLLLVSISSSFVILFFSIAACVLLCSIACFKSDVINQVLTITQRLSTTGTPRLTNANNRSVFVPIYQYV